MEGLEQPRKQRKQASGGVEVNHGRLALVVTPASCKYHGHWT